VKAGVTPPPRPAWAETGLGTSGNAAARAASMMAKTRRSTPARLIDRIDPNLAAFPLR
jgi:hypothetical protein